MNAIRRRRRRRRALFFNRRDDQNKVDKQKGTKTNMAHIIGGFGTCILREIGVGYGREKSLNHPRLGPQLPPGSPGSADFCFLEHVPRPTPT